MPSDPLIHEELLLRVAQLYYEQDRTQQEIGQRLHLTRWKIGRLLAEARSSGIVRIEIVHPRARRREEERALREAFGLRDAVVVPADHSASEHELRAAVAVAAAEYLADLRPSPQVLGVSWGRMLDQVAAKMPPGWARGTAVVQVNGAMSRSPHSGFAADVATVIARQAAGTATLLPVPAIVEQRATKEALEREPSVASLLTRLRQLSVVLFSLGAMSARSVLVESGYLSPGDVIRLSAAGAVGDVLGRFIDTDGDIVDPCLDDRTLGLTLPELRKISTTIAVASGAAKHAVARAAVASRLCTVLVTDQQTARHLLEER